MVDGDANVAVTVRAGAVSDETGTLDGETTASGTFASAEAPQELILNFMGSRGQATIAAQPNLTRLLGNNASSGVIEVTQDFGLVQLHTGNEGPVWAALDAQWSDIDGLESFYSHLTIGAHADLEDETLLGVMVQLDHMRSNEADGPGEISDSGFLVGPYWVARYGDVDVDARLPWGQTENEVSAFGTYTGTFSTTRWLAMVNITGTIETDNATFRPLLGISVLDDRSEAYIDAASDAVAAQHVRMGEIELGVDWELPLGPNGALFTGGLAGHYTGADGVSDVINGARARLDLALSNSTGPIHYNFGTFADGLFTDDQERYGADLSLEWRF